jgi:hypothetical protein
MVNYKRHNFRSERSWMPFGKHGRYEMLVDGHNNTTGWCRCTNGITASGEWPTWNNYTGEVIEYSQLMPLSSIV